MAHVFKEGERSDDVIVRENVSFESLLLPTRVLHGLEAGGFRKPSPIQLKAIPLARCGFDLIVQSKSGTGKTLVFATTALEVVDVTFPDLQVLILAPTREIAVQIEDVIKQLGTGIKGLNVQGFIGGVPVKEDRLKLVSCHIAVGAPGRVRHLIEEGVLKTGALRLFVIDEADKLLESSFQGDLNEIYHKLPEKKQMIATSATYPDELDKFVSNYMHRATLVSVVQSDAQLLLGLRQYVAVIKAHVNVVQQMKIKNAELKNILSKVPFTQCIIFTNYQVHAESLSNLLNQQDWKTCFISAAQSQPRRLEVIRALKNMECRILFSTDLTARGIDASNVDLVINYGVPKDASTYLHRMGRAGRYGSRGICISICNDAKELSEFQHILATIGGSEMTVPILPVRDEFPRDLHKMDASKFNQLPGKLLEKVDNMSKMEIKQSVLEMKDPDLQEGKGKRKSKKKKAKELAELQKASIKPEVVEQIETPETNVKSDEDLKLQKLLKSWAENQLLDRKEANSGATKDSDDKKRKFDEIAASDSQDINKRGSLEKGDILAKNLALLNITKLLTTECETLEEFTVNVKKTSGDCKTLIEISEKSVANRIEALQKDTDGTASAILKNITLSSTNKSVKANDTQDSKPSTSVQNTTMETETNEKVNPESQILLLKKSSPPSQDIAVEHMDTKDDNSENALENVIQNAFDFACGKSDRHWLEHLPEEEKCETPGPSAATSQMEDGYYMVEENASSDFYIDEANADSVVETNVKEDQSYNEEVGNLIEANADCMLEADVEEDREYNEEVGNLIGQWHEVKSHDSPNVKNGSRVGSANSQYTHNSVYVPIYEQRMTKEDIQYYTRCYNQCFEELKNCTLNNCYGSNSFEEAYDKWQFKMVTLRDYVQRNIYIAEMAMFQRLKCSEK